ncbi:class I SAM-dependent DNA methyltransferase [Paenibacillus allorhizosphaerae]|uniref:Carboxy-S-adenosyl-L-methionine synthase n=1 Tax=Paenibacillus allorhizosphaerae TaxID=2849866 RepID=A0ABM8VFF4_9BACL|nr:class I SAM-dependent methyltransferase [Paenibacillus allorhizosphaerae]CAG7634861.1 Carboxy-S-adenosyl-L-methionine synthase [Paenibacillus allorhizosphaerae]
MAYQQFSYLYDRLMEDMPYDDWVRFARQCWDKYGSPRTVVDLGCGTGSTAIPLAKQGYEVIGIDLSEDMLAIADQKAAAEQRRTPFLAGGSVQWLQQDMREWDIGRPADAVISFCDCFNYLLEEDDWAQAFKRTYEGLAEGGVFLFDMHTPLQLHNYAESQPFLLNEEDIAYIWTSDFDSSRCEIEHALTIFFREGDSETGSDDALTERFQRIEEVHVQRAYPIVRVEEMLRRAGFRDISCYADFYWKKPSEDTERAFFLAVK